MDGITNGPHAGDPPTVLQSADVVELNRALAEAQERIRALEAVIEADRTRIIDGVNALEKVLRGRFWLTEGRGSYEWNDDRYRKEFGDAARAALKAVEPLRKIGADLTNCPPTTDEVIAARRNKDARIAELEGARQAHDLAFGVCREIAQISPESLRKNGIANGLVVNARRAIEAIQAALATHAPEPREESCHICGKLKGQPPERCPGHYSGTPSDPANFASTPASFTPAPERPDTRQKQIVEWAVDNFGEVARNGTERALRFIEEAIELVQAQGLSRERVLLCLDRAYSRPAGELGNEIGGTMLTLEALAEVLGFNVEEETIREFNRISSIPKEKWQQKHAEKVAAGSAIDAMKEAENA